MTVIARRYANALFEAASERNELDAVSAAVQALGASLEDVRVSAFLLDARVPRERKKDALVKAFQGAPNLFLNFLRVVVERRSEAAFANLPREFHRLVLASRGEAQGRLEVAALPDSAELERLRTKAQEFFGVRVDFLVEHKPELLGGFRLTVNNRRLDASVRTRLHNLKKELLSVSIG